MRIKRGTLRATKRKRLLLQTKGYRWGRKKLVRAAHTAVLKAGVNAYRDRKRKKRTARRAWHVQLNAAVRPYQLSYSRFMGMLKKHQIGLDRKVLAAMAEHQPASFQALIDHIKRG